MIDMFHKVIDLKSFLAVMAHIPAAALAIAVATLSTPTHASEPAFDCAKAKGQAQQLVCTDEAVAALDRQLSEVYQTALKNLPSDNLTMAKAEQRGWIKGRDDCWKAGNIKACVTESYQTRIVELQIVSGQLTAPSSISLDCGDRDQTPFTATFYGDTSPPAVVLTRGQDQVIAFITRSGSGARYTADGVEFWEHQGEASVDWFGTKLECTVME